jgi:hypothetical protein
VTAGRREDLVEWDPRPSTVRDRFIPSFRPSTGLGPALPGLDGGQFHIDIRMLPAGLLSVAGKVASHDPGKYEGGDNKKQYAAS